MDRRTELLNRVREDAQALAGLANGGTNIPLDQYIDKVSLNALCDSLALDPDAMQPDDLERILLIRDGLYVLRNRLRDTGDEAEHSVDRILAAGDRLYADLERALRELRADELKQAQDQIAALHRGPHIAAAAVPGTVASMSKEAAEVMMQAHVSIRNIEVNLLKIDRSNANFEVLRSVKLSVQRLSASVFAIKLSLEQTVIYQGVFKLLTDGAERIVGELRALVQQMQTTYNKASDFISQLGKLADQGTRFSRLVAEFLEKAFLQADAQEETTVSLKVQVSHQGEAILAGVTDSHGVAVLAGRNGNAWMANANPARIIPRFRLNEGPVHCLAFLPRNPEVSIDDDLFAIGTDDGLVVDDFISNKRERVVAITVAPWGIHGAYNAIVTGSRDGVVRRWTLAGGLNQFSDQHFEQVGRRVQCLIEHAGQIVAATERELVFLDRDMKTIKSVRVPFEVTSMDGIDSNTIVLCGEGHITHLNLDSGAFSRIITASSNAEYCVVAALDKQKFFFGTKAGRVGVMELASGVELGSVEVGFQLRGLVPAGKKLVAFGGDWNTRGRSAAMLTMESVTRGIGQQAP